MKCLPQLISSTFCRNRIVEACLVYVRVERGRWSSNADPELPGCAIITSANCKKSPAGSKLFLTNRWERNCLRWTSSLINIMSARTRFTYQEPAVRQKLSSVDLMMTHWRIIRTGSSRLLEYLCLESGVYMRHERPPWSWISFPWERIILTLYSDNCTPVIVEVTQQLTIFIWGNWGLMWKTYINDI